MVPISRKYLFFFSFRNKIPVLTLQETNIALFLWRGLPSKILPTQGEKSGEDIIPPLVIIYRRVRSRFLFTEHNTGDTGVAKFNRKYKKLGIKPVSRKGMLMVVFRNIQL